MSDRMLFGVLQMPMELAMADDLARLQFYNRAQQAVARMNEDAARIAALEASLRQVADQKANAERYECVRKMNPRQFTTIWEMNVAGKGAFDDLVDAHRQQEK